MASSPDTVLTSLPDLERLERGTRLLDRYTVMDPIGAGGMASIYRAHDDRLDRVVCVKLLRMVIEDPEEPAGSVYRASYSHFLQEALALSKLQHPNTLRIYDFGYLDASGRPFQVSEYLEGGNLDELVKKKGPLDVGEALAILHGIAGAVDEAHVHNIIHRDIKPSNILFARLGDGLMPKLADFGIARTELKKSHRAAMLDSEDENASGENEVASISSVALFSPRWAAPEQLCGGREGPYTDVYALGLLTMYMLTGALPFDDPDVRTTITQRVQSDAMLEKRMKDRGVPAGARQALLETLRADPDARTRTAGAMLAAMREAFEGAAARSDDLPPSMPGPKSYTTVLEVESARPLPAHPPARDHYTEEQSADATTSWSEDEPSTRPRGIPTPRPVPRASPPPPTPRRTRLSKAPAQARPSAGPPAPPEPAPTRAPRPYRTMQVSDALDFTFDTAQGVQYRFRLTILPSNDEHSRLNVKGLNCFVLRPGARPQSAIVVEEDGHLDFVNAARVGVGRVSWSFGVRTTLGHRFVVDGDELMVPYGEAPYVAAICLGEAREAIVIFRRA